MTQEDKNILLKDICGRLPYELKLCIDGGVCSLLDIDKEEGDHLNGETFYTIGFKNQAGLYNFCAISEAKPYLRPMSSMTEEEKEEYINLFEGMPFCPDPVSLLDWLDAHHFDYRGLIEKGLALEAPEDMYKN